MYGKGLAERLRKQKEKMAFLVLEFSFFLFVLSRQNMAKGGDASLAESLCAREREFVTLFFLSFW